MKINGRPGFLKVAYLGKLPWLSLLLPHVHACAHTHTLSPSLSPASSLFSTGSGSIAGLELHLQSFKVFYLHFVKLKGLKYTSPTLPPPSQTTPVYICVSAILRPVLTRCLDKPLGNCSKSGCRLGLCIKCKININNVL